jgi:hypothetical protein
MANSSVSVTPGSGVQIDSHQIGSGDQQQIIRHATADTVSSAAPTTWTVSTTASQSQITADENRVAMLIYNASTVRVYIRFDNTAPLATGTNAHWYLDAGDRYEVPYGICQLAVSIVAATSGTNTVNFTLGTET